MRRPALLSLFTGITVFCAVYAVASLPHYRSSRAIHPRSQKAITVPGQDGAAYLLFNGWRVQPVGRALRVGDFPLGASFNPEGTLLAVANSGFNAHVLRLVDTVNEREITSISLPRSWNGLCWSPDGRNLYLSAGMNNNAGDVWVVAWDGNRLTQSRVLKLSGSDKARTCVSGLAISRDGKTLYASNAGDNSLYVLDTDSGATLTKMDVGKYPGANALSPDGARLYVANWGGNEVAVVNVQDRANLKLEQRLPVGKQPNDLVLTRDNRLFVSCGGSDTVAVYDLSSQQLMETIRTSLTPNAAIGSTPNSLSVSPDGKTLFVANADNNSVCVAEIGKRGSSRVRGFLPAGWYPTLVRVTPDGKKVIIGSGKGTGTGPNALPRGSSVPDVRYTYHGTLLHGMLSFVDMPDSKRLQEYTAVVRANSPYQDRQLKEASYNRKTAIPTKVGEKSPIKYVLYIIKENRTYDQVFGDMPQGNGEPYLCYFGREITPNHHALAEQFVLLDNLYCNGEVSQDGHPWSTSAIATAYVQRAWVMGYSGRGDLPGDGSVTDPTTGYIWEACKRKGLSVRSYGEYNWHPSFGKDISEPYIGKVGPGQNPPGRDFEKADIFIEEFREMEKAGRIPHFMIMSLGEDHTDFTAPGKFTMQACVASNDLALGKIVEAISKSSVWKEYAIFVIEDDAQNAPDHVDSHRTVGLVISPYTRRGTVDSTMYSTCSMLRTMELILGIPPLTQFDAAAAPMFNSFTDRADLTPYSALPARVDLNARNPKNAPDAQKSALLDREEYDGFTMAEEDAVNRIMWHAIKGKDAPYPAPVRGMTP